MLFSRGYKFGRKSNINFYVTFIFHFILSLQPMFSLDLKHEQLKSIDVRSLENNTIIYVENSTF